MSAAGTEGGSGLEARGQPRGQRWMRKRPTRRRLCSTGAGSAPMTATGPCPATSWPSSRSPPGCRARSMGVAARVIEAAAERHGLALTIGAVLFVATLPGRARVRSPAAPLASLLQRPAGLLTPESFTRRPHTEPPLDTAEALGIAAWPPATSRIGCSAAGTPPGSAVASRSPPPGALAAFARKLQRASTPAMPDDGEFPHLGVRLPARPDSSNRVFSPAFSSSGRARSDQDRPTRGDPAMPRPTRRPRTLDVPIAS